MLANARVLVFAKAPVAGKVKTRLIPAIGELEASGVHRSMLLHTMQTVAQSPLAPVQLWCAPGYDHEIFRELAQKYEVTLRRQQGPDLGGRMSHALHDALTTANKVVIIGSDCAVLKKRHIIKMFETLDSFDASIVPASDGGYVALGLRCVDNRLFDGIDWGTELVLNQTLNRLDRLGWRYKLEKKLWDVDRPEDLKLLLQILARENQDGSEHLQGIFSPTQQMTLRSKLLLAESEMTGR